MGMLGTGQRSSNTEPYFCPAKKKLPHLRGFLEGAPCLTSAKGGPFSHAS